MAAQQPVAGAPTIREALEAARKGLLVGRKCTGCGRVTFVDEIRCPVCHKQQFARLESKGDGEIVTFTIVGFPAEAFALQGPYAFVIVRMSEGAATSGWMPGVKDPREIPIGTRVKVVPSPEGRGTAFAKA